MEKKTMTCINCPMGCQVTVEYELKDGKANPGSFVITGNTCPRGKTYAESEMTDPVRTVTGTVSVTGGELPVISVKTDRPVPKDLVMDVADELMKIKAASPVKIGDIVAANICGTDANIVATSNVRAC